MKVICISGKAQHGKEETAIAMSAALKSRGNSVLITHYADLLKYICKNFFEWDGQKDERGRELLQTLGTNTIRFQNPGYLVNFLADSLGWSSDLWDYVLIPDCRFPNEIDVLKERGFDTVHVRVIRDGFESPLTEEQQRHASETALDDAPCDYYINNIGSLDDLRWSVELFVKEWRV